MERKYKYPPPRRTRRRADRMSFVRIRESDAKLRKGAQEFAKEEALLFSFCGSVNWNIVLISRLFHWHRSSFCPIFILQTHTDSSKTQPMKKFLRPLLAACFLLSAFAAK